MIFLTYVPLNFLYELAFPPKETKKMDLQKDDEQIMEQEEAAAKAAAKAEAIEKGGDDGAVDLEAENESKASKQQNNVE
jgi:hypothetical protein